MSRNDEDDLQRFRKAIADATSALMRVYERAEKQDDGRKMSQALRAREMLQKSGQVMAEICEEA